MSVDPAKPQASSVSSRRSSVLGLSRFRNRARRSGSDGHIDSTVRANMGSSIQAAWSGSMWSHWQRPAATSALK